ncbi:hypothetical protein PSQ19_10555 [Devosia algicola]|uniref:C-type lysozyme inhibitor domain-containing protein n=1 Tax=Devosia algicola TaxID=3026418 RepID=A0ABY7YJD1_9HYPH|nr:hypothetical protein [Devosia algicola]WDR01287.1 hypothetical protein PSQ19_10555 [Devosia algicola]
MTSWIGFWPGVSLSLPEQISAEFYGDLSGIAMNETVSIRVQGASGTAVVSAQKIDRSRAPGMFVRTSASDPAWKILAGSNHIVISAKGAVLAVLSNVDTVAATSFLADCTPAAGHTAQAVVPTAPPDRDTQPAQANALVNNDAPAQDQGKLIGVANDQDSLFVQGLAVGAGLAGAAVIANEVVDQLFTEAPAPGANAVGEQGMLGVDIISVRANDTTFGFGGDEVFLLFSNGARFPNDPGAAQDINRGEEWAPNAHVDGYGAVSVDLREWDSIGASDLIGNIAINASQGTGRFTQTLTGDGANYLVTYDVRVARGAADVGQPAAPAPSPATSRVWSNGGAYETVTALDCRDDCEEDIGIIFMCTGLGLPASVDIPWVSTEQGPAGRTGPITFNVDGQRFQYTAHIGNYGLVGHIPSFTVNPDDPFVGALQAGANARVSFDGAEANIGLKGSRSALDIFKAHCGWNNIADDSPVSAQPAESNPIWFAGQYTDGSGRLVHSLTYGIPETDAIGFSALCLPGSDRIEAVMSVDFGNLQNGAQTSAYVQALGQTFQYSGQVLIQSEESAGVLIRTSPNDPMWQALSSARPSATFGMIGGGRLVGSSQGATDAIGKFLPACQSAAPSNQLNPALTNQSPRQRPANQSGSNQPPSGQTPTGQSTDFTCNDGTTMRVAVAQAGPGTVASVSRNGGAAFQLDSAPAPFGERYTDGTANLTINAGNLALSAPGIAVSCRAN